MARGDGRGVRDGARASLRLLWSQGGQSTLEYALVLGSLLASVLALASVWRAGGDGSLQRVALEAASHVLGGGGSQGLRDVLLF
jgi:hypothetical protein